MDGSHQAHDDVAARHYVLRGGEMAAERLRILSQAIWRTTEAALQRAGLKPGLRCLDVGCGSGNVTVEMARRVAPDGEVHGLDADASVLVHARQFAEAEKVPARFSQMNVAALSFENEYDFAYSRFLLTHLPWPDQAVAGIVRALKPGGVFVVEDIDFAGHFCHPPCGAFRRYIELYEAVVRRNGGDPLIGPRLLQLLTDGGLEDVEVEVVLPTFAKGDGKRIAQITLEHIREHVVAANLASHAELDATLVELKEFTHSPRTILSLPRIFQVWGRKPIA